MDSSMSALDPDFDFLSYLDASLVDSAGGNTGSSSSGFASPQHEAASSSSSGSGSSNHSFSASNTQYAATSPSSTSSSAGYARSPLFGVANNGIETGFHQVQQQPSPAFGNFEYPPAPSSYTNSPPFDTSIFTNFQAQQQAQPQQHTGQESLKLQNSLNNYNFAQHGSAQSDYWTQVYLQQALQNQYPGAVQVPQAPSQASSTFLSPKAVPDQTPSLGSNSNQGSPFSDVAFDQSIPVPSVDRRWSTYSNASTLASHSDQPLYNSTSLPASGNLTAIPEEQNLPQQGQTQADGDHISLIPVSKAQHVQTVARPHAGNKVAKTNLKRSYQQAIKEEAATPSLLVPQAPGMEQSGSNDSSTNTGDSGKENKKAAPGGHNAVEQKYRRGINDSLIMLREIVPALGHLRAVPGTEPNKRKLSQFSLAASATPAAPAAYVDGVPAPKKLSKQLILVTATDYIRYLKSRRDELEGEVQSLKAALDDCVEDSQVVYNVHEERWAPERAKILEERMNIYSDREQAKESSKKRAKMDKDDAKAANAESKNNSFEDESDDDEDDDLADVAVASAIPAKGQIRARGNAAKKASGASKAGATASRPAARQQQQGNVPPRALMSVFAGVSFAGGAGYDMIYGATGAQQAANPETPRVWSQGLVKRSSGLSESVQNATTTSLHPLQSFFIERPALLSGLVMVSLSLSIAYIAFYLVPALWSRLTGSNREQKQQSARETLIQASQPNSAISTRQQRAALALLAGAPSSTVGQVVRLPTLALAAMWALVFGSPPSYFSNDAEQGELEQAASSVRLFEQDLATGTKLSRTTSFLHLYTLVHTSWPQVVSSLSLLARAEASLALSLAKVSGRPAQSTAARLWTFAQSRLKKSSSGSYRPPWLLMALAMPLDEARKASSLRGSPASSLYQSASLHCEGVLLQAWSSLFTDVMNATLPDQSEDGSATPKAKQAAQVGQDTNSQVDEVLAVMPAKSFIASFALLFKAVQAVGRNDTVTALKAAHVLSSEAEELASVRAFVELVSGRKMVDIDSELKSSLDRIAYATIAWLAVRQSATALKEGASATDSGMQSLTIKLRKLLATEPFSAEDASEAFINAQERCIEGLVRIGRKASGLDALEDSGCEL